MSCKKLSIYDFKIWLIFISIPFTEQFTMQELSVGKTFYLRTLLYDLYAPEPILFHGIKLHNTVYCSVQPDYLAFLHC
jgi:hypothetical protein